MVCFYGAGGGGGGGCGPYESQTAGVLYNENQFSRHIYFLEKMYLEIGKSICFSSEHRQQNIVMSGGCLEEAENNKKF